MKTYTTILLDWDGNIANTLPGWLQLYHEIAQIQEMKITDSDIVENAFGTWDSHKYFGMQYDELQNLIHKLMEKYFAKTELYPGVAEVLKELKNRNKKLVIVTTNYKDTIKQALDENRIAQFIDLVIAGEDVKEHKPSPEGIFKAIKLLDSNTQESIMIGDGDKDVGAGKNAGIDTIIHYPKAHELIYSQKFIEDLNANYIIKNFNELLKILV